VSSEAFSEGWSRGGAFIDKSFAFYGVCGSFVDDSVSEGREIVRKG